MIDEIRHARNEEFPSLRSIEAAADTCFAEMGMAGLPAPADIASYTEAIFVLVYGEPPVGFARVTEVDGNAHLEQISVLPQRGRTGIGARLLESVVAMARERRYTRVTLITFEDVPWNAPFYLRHGFRLASTLGAGITALREREKHMGLDDLGIRTVLACNLLE